MVDYRIDRLQLRDLRFLHANGFDVSQPMLSTDHSPKPPKQHLGVSGESGSVDPQVKKLVDGLMGSCHKDTQ